MPSGFERDRSQVVNTYTAGLHFKPIPNVVVKLDYRNRSARAGALGDEVNAGIGVVF
jgi:opacity protein-like surface antigen